MNQLACKRLVLFLALALGSALASSEALRPLDNASLDASRHRRSLLGATQQISQCDWIQGEGCALHPAYASYALNRSSDDVVAQYVANALACATATDKGLCESASYCYWDPAFSNGQQGCFLQDDALLSLQLRCVQEQYLPSFSKLQACMAARQSCQCSSTTTSGGSATAGCTQRQQQLLTSYGPGKDKVCRSLLGCWLSSLNSSSTDLTQLVETQLLVVQPKIESLSSSGGSSSSSATNGTTGGSSGGGGRRRALQQIPPSLSDPVLDDKSGSNDAYTPESGSYGSGSGSGAAGAPSVGMNGVVTEDQAAMPVTATTPVENGRNVPAPNKANGGGSSSSGSSNNSVGLNLESGAVGNDWVLEQAPVDPDQVFGAAGGSTAGSSGSSSGDGSVQMSGGNAPASFWQCAASAAAKANSTRKWADIDYNSKTLTLATWLKVIQPTSLVDWGVQVLECFKTEVPKLNNLDVNVSSNSTKPNKESLEFAIVALIRAFTGKAESFRAYLQAGADARPATAMSELSRLTTDVFPGQLSGLMSKYQTAPAYRRDIMLQTAAIITDLQWFAADVRSLASKSGDSSAQQEAFEGYITYGEESIRRCLYWLFFVQFDGPPAHLPGPIPSSAASTAVVSAFEGLAAAALPAPTVAADSPMWQQLQVMMAAAAGSAAAAAAQAGAEFDSSQVLGNTVAGLARAHVQDLWGSRLELARTGAPDAARQLALLDPNVKSARWEPLRTQQLAMLAALQERAALGRSEDDSANLRLARALRDLVAASGAYLLTSADGPTSQQQQKQQELSSALALSGRLSLLIRQCYGSPAGLPALSEAAAAKAGIPAKAAEACAQLSAQADKVVPVARGGVVGNTLLADLDRQWRCNSHPAATCSSKPGCALALAPTLVPGIAVTGLDNMVLACQASDASLFLSSLDSSAKSALAVGPTCDQFLKLPACETVDSAAMCSSLSTCRWELSAQRNVLHTATSTAAKGAPPAGSKGVCAVDWVAVLSTTGGGSAYNSLNSMIQLCSGIGDNAQCQSQSMLITMDVPSTGTTSMARFWVPALVVAGVVGVLLFGAAIWWRRRSAAARRAADEARGAAGGGRGNRRGGKDGKGGKGAKVSKKKPKRAEPGSYKPDLMRDSFTDYMRAAPQQFNNGVAIAKAAMATGDLDTAVAVADVAGGRQLPQHHQQLAGGAGIGGMYGSGRSPSPESEPSWGLGVASGVVAGSQGSSDLIDLSQSDVSGHHISLGSNTQQQQDQQGSAVELVNSGGGSAAAAPGRLAAAGPAAGGASSVWGSAAAAAGMGLTGSPGLVSPRGLGFAPNPHALGGRPPLHGDMSVPVNLLDANASIALTSSINLVSSLPQHSSLPMGFVSDAAGHYDAAAFGMPGGAATAGAARATFGASNSLARISSSSLAASAYQGRSGNFEGANSGALLLPTAASRGGVPASEDGCTTPTSSCCHDSVCTFGHGPSSVVSSSSGSRGGGAGPQPSPTGRISPAGAGGAGARGGAAAGSVASAGGLSGAPSVPLSRSSWSSAMSTDALMSTQNSSAISDP